MSNAIHVAAGEACVRRRSRRKPWIRGHPDTPWRLILRRLRRRSQPSAAAT